MKRFIILFAAALLAASCIKGEPFICRSLVMGNFVGGDLLVDGGLTFHVVKMQVDVTAKPEDRVIALCDVMKQTGSSDKEYDVKLLDYDFPLNKAPLVSSAVTDREAVGDDPVIPSRYWFSGGFFNMLVKYYYIYRTDKTHVLNLVKDDARSNADTLFFSLRHNAAGETPGAADIDINNLVEGAVYATFPIADSFPAGRDSVVVKISGKWYTGSSFGIDPSTQPYSYVGVCYKEDL